MSSLAAHKGSGSAYQPWLKDSVRTFFKSLAWDGRPPQAVGHRSLSSPTSESLMTLTVSAFFEAVPWEGQPMIAAPVAPIEMLPGVEAPSSDAMTLDAFSDLF